MVKPNLSCNIYFAEKPNQAKLRALGKLRDPLLKTLALHLVFYSLIRNLNRVLLCLI